MPGCWPSPNGRRPLRKLAELLEQPVRVGINPPVLPVWHCSIHNHPDDPTLSDQQWQRVATEVATVTGLAPHGDTDAVRWIGIRHADTHIHLVATLVRQDRRTVWAWHDYHRAQRCCRKLEQHYGLRRVGVQRPDNRWPTPAEMNKTTRQDRDEVPRNHLQRIVRATASTASNEQDFVDRLHEVGLLVRLRLSTTSPNQIVGYAVALPDDYNAAGETIWYSGSRLAVDLTLTNLRLTWRSS
ncbi:relaxase/mobilization nuclease domain-containing protein [Micromonospora sp. NPDC049523]|uniref:relaxase/mobilization nuclease domain-containing protein n=1 Tax=Micromonospora sp. NPDC049523 TaxID=3155921 RepID=UPI00343533C7